MHGLQNLGNTCGINSLIQCIGHTKLLRDALTRGKQDDLQTVTFQLTDVVNKLDNSSVAPEGLITVLFASHKGLLVPGEQQDMVELWMLIVDKIAAEIGVEISEEEYTKIYSQHSPGDDFVRQVCLSRYMHNNKKASTWIDTVQGTQLSVIECPCGFTQANAEVFTNIAVNVPLEPVANGKYMQLTDLIGEYFSREPLECWKCDACSKVGQSSKRNVLLTCPPVLVITLKRFTSRGDKINTQVDVAEMFKCQDMNYRLVALGQHHGVYAGGHYIAICRNDGDWMLYDDDKIYNIGSQLKYERSAIYFLVYERIFS